VPATPPPNLHRDNVDGDGNEASRLSSLTDVSDDTGSALSLNRTTESSKVERKAQIEALLGELAESALNKPMAGAGGLYPLQVAVKANLPDIVSLLLDRGAEITPTTSDINKFGTPLHVAAASGRSKCLELLLERGADASVAMAQAMLPIHTAAKVGNNKAIVLLAKAFPQGVKSTNATGDTPLHLAAERGDMKSITCLVRLAPATLLSHNEAGKTPAEVAQDDDVREKLDTLTKALSSSKA